MHSSHMLVKVPPPAFAARLLPVSFFISTILGTAQPHDASRLITITPDSACWTYQALKSMPCKVQERS